MNYNNDHPEKILFDKMGYSNFNSFEKVLENKVKNHELTNKERSIWIIMRVFKAYSSVIGDSFWWLVAVVLLVPFLNFSYDVVISISILALLIVDFIIRMFVGV